jgi:AcrR family transcriptional regulator
VHRNYHHGNLREALVQEGVKLIEEKGVNGLTLREIGVRAGVSRTAAYRHFADKSDLLSAISEAAFTEFGLALQAARDSAAGTSYERMDAMGRAYLKFAAEHKAYYEVMFGVGCDFDKDAVSKSEAGERAFAVLKGTIQEGQDAGEIRPGDVELMATLVWAFSHGVAMLRSALGLDTHEAADQFMSAVSDMLRNGLQARQRFAG